MSGEQRCVKCAGPSGGLPYCPTCDPANPDTPTAPEPAAAPFCTRCDGYGVVLPVGYSIVVTCPACNGKTADRPEFAPPSENTSRARAVLDQLDAAGYNGPFSVSSPGGWCYLHEAQTEAMAKLSPTWESCGQGVYAAGAFLFAAIDPAASVAAMTAAGLVEQAR